MFGELTLGTPNGTFESFLDGLRHRFIRDSNYANNRWFPM